MAGNIQRSTPGLISIVWAVLLTTVVIFSWWVQQHRSVYDWNEFPTALGDRDYYTQLSENDLYTPALRFQGHDHGLFRRATKPVARNDAKMRRGARDASNRVFVYQDSRHPGSFTSKWRMTATSEFGERKFWPEYQPPKAIPVTLEAPKAEIPPAPPH